MNKRDNNIAYYLFTAFIGIVAIVLIIAWFDLRLLIVLIVWGWFQRLESRL